MPPKDYVSLAHLLYQHNVLEVNVKTHRTHFAHIVLISLIFFTQHAGSTSVEQDIQGVDGSLADGVIINLGAYIQAETDAQPTIRESIIFDESGDSNELILMPDYADGSFIRRAVPSVVKGTSMRPEEVLLHAVNINDPVTQSVLEYPTGGARYLIETNRLSESQRRTLRNDDSLERLQRYIILSYGSVVAAQQAKRMLSNLPGIAYISINQASELSFSPNDPYFQVNSQPPLYQWGMHAMSLPSAWDKTKGHGYVGIIDSASSNTAHADLSNIRPQLSFINQTYNNPLHGQHVAGIIAGTQNNSIGVSGGCPNCSISLAQSDITTASIAASVIGLIDRGVSTINMSFGSDGATCATRQPICDAIAVADTRDVVLVAAAGNYTKTVPQFPASHPSVLSVGGAQSTGGTGWIGWYYGYASNESKTVGTNWAGSTGVMAPAKSVVSTTPIGGSWNPWAQYKCADTAGVDESGTANDGYASCTGTSMSAPHITSLVALLRSIQPQNNRNTIKSIIRQSGSQASVPNSQYGYGMPNANSAVTTALSYNPRRLTPLFSFYSSGRQDYFYTTSPQMAAAAVNGTIQPSHNAGFQTESYSTIGTGVYFYFMFPGMGSGSGLTPGAQAWIFTTPTNPFSTTTPLVPLYRMSWKCGDSYSPACAANPNHTDFVYTTESAGISEFQSIGYKLDGIEGYIYPKTLPRPSGAAKLMRKYNPTRDDHAIFPESELANMIAQGYTLNSGSDWLGYVYPNLTGNIPSY